jgi:hypothetical protein
MPLLAHDPTKWNRFVDKIMRKVIELERDLLEKTGAHPRIKSEGMLFRIAL